ncbi:Cof-type HAD-IIB family hydrolase [Maledivibacter halophilus]|uniref:Cof subfamily of IIB subfamily of haloacid dehalogenase superfamily/HAD-superfamily hydrolase, subfamily IIB n=1 Tax=Maledivibacter halophilus TaxID=36842 RepID=A0A1T5KD91_9FIRM|nr:Cof-type HAD-IIB family hydrolase [Maledivibacter halophilus]SKC61489.1 hypothetical protein SAMN02194393_01691 [Maledivibacter halophilus]
MNYKLVSVDLDGTLLNSKDEIDNRTAALMKKAMELEVKFAMCSARIYLSTQYYNMQIDKRQPVITNNGGLITINEKEVFSNPLNIEELFEIIDIAMAEKNDIYFSFGNGDISRNCVCTNKITTINRINSEYNQIVPPEFRIDAKLVKEPITYIQNTNNAKIYKISFIDENPIVLKRINNRLRSLNKYEVTSSEANNIEVTQKGVNKGNALEKLAEYYGYALDECIAIGNDKNDLSMIKKAGLGVAMNNSNSFIKQYAKYITQRDNNNGGVAEIIEKFILS